MTATWERAMEADATFLTQNWIMKCQCIHFSCYFCSESNARSEYVLCFAQTLMGITVPPSHGVSCHPVQFEHFMILFNDTQEIYYYL